MSLKAHHPDIDIDIFTDAPLPDTVPDDLFSQVHMLPISGPRPRFYAMRETRFERSIILDADLLAVAPVDDIFEVLGTFDIAIAHDQWRNSPKALRMGDTQIPNAFPQFNSGVFGLRASPATRAFIDRWEETYVAHSSGYDQAGLREVLWHSPDLRVATLPSEYNLWDYRSMSALRSHHTAPRILHCHLFMKPRVLALDAGEIPVSFGHARHTWLQMLLDSDLTLGGQRGAGFTLRRKLGWAWAFIRDIPRKLLAGLGRRYP